MNRALFDLIVLFASLFFFRVIPIPLYYAKNTQWYKYLNFLNSIESFTALVCTYIHIYNLYKYFLLFATVKFVFIKEEIIQNWPAHRKVTLLRAYKSGAHYSRISRALVRRVESDRSCVRNAERGTKRDYASLRYLSTIVPHRPCSFVSGAIGDKWRSNTRISPIVLAIFTPRSN